METIHDTTDSALFPRVPEDELRRLAECCAELRLAAGEALFTEEEPPRDFFFVLDGEIRVSKRVGAEEVLLAAHGPGEFTGDLSLVTGRRETADARAGTDTRLLRIAADDFGRVMAEHPRVAEVVFRALSGRARELNAEMQRTARVESLGTLASGLAHQLNNPAAAAARAAGRTGELLRALPRLALELAELPLTAEQRDLLASTLEGTAPGREDGLSPLARSDREDELGAWLGERGVPRPWELVSSCVDVGLDQDALAGVAARMPPATQGAVLEWLCTSAAAQAAAAEVRQAVSRVSALVDTVRAYAYMDQAPVQEVDVREGLESSLTLLLPRTPPGVRVERDFEAGLPRVHARGAELNEAWTHLIANALDAVGAGGLIRIAARLEGDQVVVEVADDGPGIPAELRHRVWEPFFTTKPAGDAAGLGLDIVRRIVVRRHGGEIRFRSVPGDTCFQVRLPVLGAHGGTEAQR